MHLLVESKPIHEEDQLRIISMQQGGDIKQALLGFISSCSTNLGTLMRASLGAGDHRCLILLLFSIYRAYFIGLVASVITRLAIGMMCCIRR
jgi:hypothetical protein